MSYRSTFPLPSATAPESFGVNIHFIDWGLENIKRIAEAGFKWIRMDFLWNYVEYEKGHYDCSRYDRLLQECKKYNLRVLAIVCYGNPLYYNDEQKALAASLPESEKLTIAPGDDNPEYKAAFLRFAKNVVRRYQKKGIVWELWNEPNLDQFWKSKDRVADYASLLRDFAKTVRSVHYFEWIAGPASSTFDWDFLEGIVKLGALDHLDMVTVHPYREMVPESVKPDWARLRTLVEVNKPSWRRIALASGEWGYSESQFNGYVEPTPYQAQVSAVIDTKTDAAAAEAVRNLLSNTENFSASEWTGYWVKPKISPTVGPDGRKAAWRAESADKPDQPGQFHSGFLQLAKPGTRPLGKYYLVSCWLRSTAGTQEILLGVDDGYMASRWIDETWQRYAVLFYLDHDTDWKRIFQVYERGASNAAWEIAYPQTEIVEDVDENVLRQSQMEQQADYVPRMFKANIESGVALSIWYDWQNDGPDPKTVWWQGFGIIDNNGDSKPAEQTMKTLAGFIREWGPLLK